MRHKYSHPFSTPRFDLFNNVWSGVQITALPTTRFYLAFWIIIIIIIIIIITHNINNNCVTYFQEIGRTKAHI
jgi:hypothetical protein